MGIRRLSTETKDKRISILTSNQTVLQAIGKPRRQSGQTSIRCIYEIIQSLRERGNRITMVWIPATGDLIHIEKAKQAARTAAEQDQATIQAPYRAISTLTTNMLKKLPRTKLPDNIGGCSKKLDTALPGNIPGNYKTHSSDQRQIS